MSLLWLYFVLLRATVLAFSGFASVPMVRDDLVLTTGLLDDTQLNGSIAISQVAPGPLGMYIVAVGYFVKGIPGAICGLLALSTPPWLVLAIAKLLRVGSDEWVRKASAGIVIASSMLVAVTGIGFGLQASSSGLLFAITVASFSAIILNWVPPIMAVVGGVLTSVIVSSL